MAGGQLPPLPQIDDEVVRDCIDRGRCTGVLFEWYKHVGSLAITVASIDRRSPGLRMVEPIRYYVLRGLLTRCARLMLANIKLTCDATYGETMSILARCVWESAALVQWLCKANHADRFQRFLADALKTDLLLKAEIEDNIRERGGGDPLTIEARMLWSIEKSLSPTGLSEEQVRATKRLPTFEQILRDVGQDHLYLAVQRLGSHSIHGTWTALSIDYLREDQGELVPRDCTVEPHPNHYTFGALAVLDAIEAFLRFVSADEQAAVPFLDRIRHVKREVLKANKAFVGDDFSYVESAPP